MERQSEFSEVSTKRVSTVYNTLHIYLHNLPWGNWISRGLWVAASTTERAMVPIITLLEIKALMIVCFMSTAYNLIQPSL